MLNDGQELVELGIIEEFIIREIGANPRMTGPKWNAFLKDFRQSIAKDPNLPDVSLKDLYKKHNLSKGMMDVAGKFMSLPGIKTLDLCF